MRFANAHIAQVAEEYRLGNNKVLGEINDLHQDYAHNETCIDHATFVARYSMRDHFIKHWENSGLQALAPLHTKKYPAEHIALINSETNFAACDSMIGLSVSKDIFSPINEFLDRYSKPGYGNLPGNLQHVAVNISGDIDMYAFVKKLQEKGIAFMTPVLHTVQHETRTHLRQAFTACDQPYSHFLELIQRTEISGPMPDDHLEEVLFNTDQIDTLYRLYDRYSKRLMKSA